MATTLIAAAMTTACALAVGWLATRPRRADTAASEADAWLEHMTGSGDDAPAAPPGAPEFRHLTPGWRVQLDADTAVLPELDPPTARPYIPPVAEPPYVARHRQEDTVDLTALRRVSAGWMPPVGATRLHAITDDTQQMGAVQ